VWQQTEKLRRINKSCGKMVKIKENCGKLPETDGVGGVIGFCAPGFLFSFSILKWMWGIL